MFIYNIRDSLPFFHADKSVFDYLDKRKEVIDSQLDILYNAGLLNRAVSNLDVRHLDPGISALVPFSQGQLSDKRAQACISRHILLDDNYFERIRGGKISVDQSEVLFPEQETRGKALQLVSAKNAEPFAESFDSVLCEIDESLGPGWAAFRNIIKTITIVEIIQQKNIPYFSGSCSEYWGAMHISIPQHTSVLTETIAHEAAHFWLHAIEEISDFCSGAWDGPNYVSPWREDPRPLAGVIHGVGVFACAIVTLGYQLDCGFYRGVDIDIVSERICRLIAQVECGYEEIISSGAYTATDLMVINGSLESIQCMIRNQDNNKLCHTRDIVRAQQASKREQFFG
jgi:hypothetical protein